MNASLLFNLQVDCEATQLSVRNPALGERAIRGLGEVLAAEGLKGTFLVIPTDLEAHGAIYRELERAGHEIGLHYHPDRPELPEFLGVMGPEEQRRVLAEACERFARVMGHPPLAFVPGYFSANDHTFGVLEGLGFTHGGVSLPTRNLPQCACTWAGSPLDPHYPHRHHRSLVGDVNFVDLPPTVDPESRMWGGAHPQDLRVELVDAKNHWHTIDKSVRRQLAQKAPLTQIRALTHNLFEYGDRTNFRRETLLGIVAATRAIAEREGLRFEPATMRDLATAYRKAVPHETARPQEVALDTRGRTFNKG